MSEATEKQRPPSPAVIAAKRGGCQEVVGMLGDIIPLPLHLSLDLTGQGIHLRELQ